MAVSAETIGLHRSRFKEVNLMPLLLSFFGTDGFFFNDLLLERTEQENVYKMVGALNWQDKGVNLQRDPDLRLLLSMVGTI